MPVAAVPLAFQTYGKTRRKQRHSRLPCAVGRSMRRDCSPAVLWVPPGPGKPWRHRALLRHLLHQRLHELVQAERINPAIFHHHRRYGAGADAARSKLFCRHRQLDRRRRSNRRCRAAGTVPAIASIGRYRHVAIRRNCVALDRRGWPCACMFLPGRACCRNSGGIRTLGDTLAVSTPISRVEACAARA